MEKRNEQTGSDRELVIDRVFNAPIELMYKVWTEPEHISKWWGPNGFTNTISKMDVRQGGEWEFVMHGPDGTDYKNRHIYAEVVENKKLVLDHMTGPNFRMTVIFTSQGEKTHVSIRMLFVSREELENTIRVFRADEGLKQNMEKLEVYMDNLVK